MTANSMDHSGTLPVVDPAQSVRLLFSSSPEARTGRTVQTELMEASNLCKVKEGRTLTFSLVDFVARAVRCEPTVLAVEWSLQSRAD
jgi:hypothetical protein